MVHIQIQCSKAELKALSYCQEEGQCLQLADLTIIISFKILFKVLLSSLTEGVVLV